MQIDTLSPRLFAGLSIYQDVLLAGRIAMRGQRDCQSRWQLIEPYLPQSGTVLDVGSNFGWFAVTICQTRRDCVVASAEADTRSILVQRHVLTSYYWPRAREEDRAAGDARIGERIALLTRRLTARRLQHWAQAQQRFDAALCLNVLHWMPDHRAFLMALGALAGRILIEHPDPEEQGAGMERVRRQIGPIGSYLAELFPSRPVVCLGSVASHRPGGWNRPRMMWLVEPPRHWRRQPSAGLDAQALLRSSVSWPPRHWWQRQLETLNHRRAYAEATLPADRILFTPDGLLATTAYDEAAERIAAQVHALPEQSPFTRWDGVWRRLRRLAGPLIG
jgi:hypothetical protein